MSGQKFQPGDLLFLGPSESRLSTAISQVARGWDGRLLTHVGIVDEQERVWEASPEHGVRFVAAQDFLESAELVVLGRLESHRQLIAPALEWIRAQLRRPYNPGFHADNVGLYCSQMILQAFEHAGGTPLFSSTTLNFFDESGKVPDFWIEWYRNRGEEVPHGQPGSHPASLSLSPLLKMSRIRGY